MPSATGKHTAATDKLQQPCLLASLRHHLSLGRLDLAVDTLPLLARRGIRPDSDALALLLAGCLRSRALPLARRVYLFLRQSGLHRRSSASSLPLANHLLAFHFLRGRPADARCLFDRMPSPNVFSFNAMLAGYARLGQLGPARRLFNRMPLRDVVSWNTMIFALARAGAYADAVSFYSQLRRSSLGFNAHTFSGLLVACVRLAEPELTFQVHAQVLLVGLLSNIVVSSSLLDSYCKCGFVNYAKKLFDEMPAKDVLAWTMLVYGYAKSGDLVSARRLFDEMPQRNHVSWTSLIGGYTRCGYPFEALDLFRNMMIQGVHPDQFTFSSCLCACAAMTALKHGKQIHAHLLRTHFRPNSIVLSSLIDMYSKCGDFVACQRSFNLTDGCQRDSVLWNTMMSAVGRHGNGREAIGIFDMMVSSGMKPDANTFVVLLTACSYSGLVDEGAQLFGSMRRIHGIVPREDHYVCLLDLLGRAGRFEEAIDCLSNAHCRSSARAWSSLLGACGIHHNLQLGRVVAQRVIKLDPECSSAYVLLSNFYALVGRWDSVEKVRHLMEERNLRKERASSWREAGDIINSVGGVDLWHPLKEDTYYGLEKEVCEESGS